MCLAALGATRAPSQCPPVLIPGLAFSIGPRLGVAASRLTSRYCGATFAAERAGVQAPCFLVSLNPGPAALASFLGYHKLPLSSVCPAHSAARSSHLLRGETWAIARPAQFLPRPLPASCLLLWWCRTTAAEHTDVEVGTLCRDRKRGLGLAQLCL